MPTIKPVIARSVQATGLQVRPLTVSIPFHLAAVGDQVPSPHPLRQALVAALRAPCAKRQT